MRKSRQSELVNVLFALLLTPLVAALFCLSFIIFVPFIAGWLLFIIFLPAIALGIGLWLLLLVREEKRWWLWFLSFSGLGFIWFYCYLYLANPELFDTKAFSPDTLFVILTFGGVGFLLWLHHRLRECESQKAAKLRDEVKKQEEIDMGVL